MSQENVEVVKRAVNAFNRRDMDGLEELGTPDIEWITSMGAIEPVIRQARCLRHTPCSGAEGARQAPGTLLIRLIPHENLLGLVGSALRALQ